MIKIESYSFVKYLYFCISCLCIFMITIFQCAFVFTYIIWEDDYIWECDNCVLWEMCWGDLIILDDESARRIVYCHWWNRLLMEWPPEKKYAVLEDVPTGRHIFGGCTSAQSHAQEIYVSVSILWSAEQLWGRRLSGVCQHEIMCYSKWLSNFGWGRRRSGLVWLESISKYRSASYGGRRKNYEVSGLCE